MKDAIERRLTGVQDSRGPVGIAARGANIYRGGSSAAHSGGGAQYGRPRTNPVPQNGPQLVGPKSILITMRDKFRQNVQKQQQQAEAQKTPTKGAIQRKLGGSK